MSVIDHEFRSLEYLGFGADRSPMLSYYSDWDKQLVTATLNYILGDDALYVREPDGTFKHVTRAILTGATLWGDEGGEYVIYPANGEKFGYDELREQLGASMLEAIPCKGCVLVVNSEPEGYSATFRNALASGFYHREAIDHDDTRGIYGSALCVSAGQVAHLFANLSE